MSTPDDRRYSREHVWLKPDGAQLLLGITEHAQAALGDLSELSLPAPGQRLAANECCGTLESVKTASDLIAPLAATVIEQNTLVGVDPGLVNNQPYEDGWLLRLSEFDAADYTSLMDATTYAAMIED
jgi:glycine cleavage system H protein